MQGSGDAPRPVGENGIRPGSEITVIYLRGTNSPGLLREAEWLARQTGARLRVLAPCVVPFPAPVNAPPVSPEFVEDEIRSACSCLSGNAEVRICYCREQEDAYSQELEPNSVVVLPRGGWLRARKITRTEAALRRFGHHVVFV